MVDYDLIGAKEHGYVPDGCYLDGFVVMFEKVAQRDPCDLCNLDRNKCGGRPKRQQNGQKQRKAHNTSIQKLPQKHMEMTYGRRTFWSHRPN